MGSTWQTVADLVRLEKHTVAGLYPNTVYLFIIRAVNSYGLSDPSPISEPVRTQGECSFGVVCVMAVFMVCAHQHNFVCTFSDVPEGQGKDQAHVQMNLGGVKVHLQTPKVLSPTSVQITWIVSILFDVHMLTCIFSGMVNDKK